MHELVLPLSAADVVRLHAGDQVRLSGSLLTARDAAHRYLTEQFSADTDREEQALQAKLRDILAGGAIYHCGPVVEKMDDGWRFVAAGPTTSMRAEKYADLVMARFGVRAIVGKGGMGRRTLAACQQMPAVYLHAPGGAAACIAQYVTQVLGVYKLEFGQPEAMWHIAVEGLPLLVTMDAHGVSLHDDIAARSATQLQQILAS